MSEPVQQLPTAVVAALRHILRPLVRLMIRHGITLPSIVELLKQVLVDVVEKDLPVEGKRTTDSRVSVLTGVHRKDVKRLRVTENERSDVPKKVSLGARVVNTWLTEPRWLDPKGKPLALPRNADDTGSPSFEHLADSVSNDVRARSILDELLRMGVVQIADTGDVELLEEAFIPSEEEGQKLFYFEQASYAHLMAGVQNLEGRKSAFFDRVVQYQSIPASALPEISALLEDKGMALLKEANVMAKRSSKEAATETESVAIGLYFFHEPGNKE